MIMKKEADEMHTGNLELARGKWRCFFDREMHLGDEHRVAATARVLESTTLFLNNVVDAESRDKRYDRYLHPIVRSVIPNLLAWEWLSVQAMGAPVSLVFRNSASPDLLEDRAVKAGITDLGTVVDLEAQSDFRHTFGLSVEAEIMAAAAENVRLELDALALSRVLEEVGDAQESSEPLRQLLWGTLDGLRTLLFGSGKRRPGRPWVVVGDGGERVSQEVAFVPSPGRYRNDPIGRFDDTFSVYSSTAVPADELLVGWRGDDPLDAGGYFSPYTLVFHGSQPAHLRHRGGCGVWDTSYFHRLRIKE